MVLFAYADHCEALELISVDHMPSWGTDASWDIGFFYISTGTGFEQRDTVLDLS